MNTTPTTRTSSSPESPPNKRKLLIILLILAIFAAVLLSSATYYWQHKKVIDLNKQVSNHEKFSTIPNQACIGLSKASSHGIIFNSVTFSASQTLLANDPDKKTANFTCTIGKNTKDATKGLEVAQIDRDGYEMGAEVIYFDSNSSAAKYAQANLEPRRYWTWDGAGSVKVFDSFPATIANYPPYFDSYVIKDNAVVRLSLPCEMPANLTQEQVQQKCWGTEVEDNIAVLTISDFSQSIKMLSF